MKFHETIQVTVAIGVTSRTFGIAQTLAPDVYDYTGYGVTEIDRWEGSLDFPHKENAVTRIVLIPEDQWTTQISRYCSGMYGVFLPSPYYKNARSIEKLLWNRVFNRKSN